MFNAKSIEGTGQKQTRRQPSQRFRDRNLKIDVLLTCIIVLAVSAMFTPEPRGLGTHTHLGVERCPYLEATEKPCPLCGTTTSLALLLDGEIGHAWKVHHMGVAIGLIMLILIPFSIVSLRFDINWYSTLRRIKWVGWVGATGILMCLFLLGWKRRIERYQRHLASKSRGITRQDRAYREMGYVPNDPP